MVIPGDTANHYVGTDVVFDAIAGGVRVVTTATGWLVQLDSNGDLVADMLIDVADQTHGGVTDWFDQFLFSIASQGLFPGGKGPVNPGINPSLRASAPRRIACGITLGSISPE